MSGVRIRCDAPDCEVLYPPAPVDGGAKAMQQRATIRQDAADAGWTICDAGQFCPDHSDVCFGKDSAN